MEASDVVAPQDTSTIDVSDIHGLLDQAEQTYHAKFEGHVPDEHHRFDAFLSTVRMIVDQSADSASKE